MKRLVLKRPIYIVAPLHASHRNARPDATSTTHERWCAYRPTRRRGTPRQTCPHAPSWQTRLQETHVQVERTHCHKRQRARLLCTNDASLSVPRGSRGVFASPVQTRPFISGPFLSGPIVSNNSCVHKAGTGKPRKRKHPPSRCTRAQKKPRRVRSQDSACTWTSAHIGRRSNLSNRSHFSVLGKFCI